MYEQSVPSTIELRLFSLSPNSFTNRATKVKNLSIDDQKQYLAEVFNQEKDIIRPLLRKITEHGFIYEVHRGWEYVDTLIRFFRNGISLPREIAKQFSEVFSDDVIINLTGIDESNKSYSNTDFNYSNLSQNRAFVEFVNRAIVEVNFIE